MKKTLILTLLLIFSVTLFAERKAKYKFRENGKYGLLDNHGKIILPAEYDSIDYLRYGMIPAIKGTYAVFIKENGEMIDKKICSWHSATYLDNVEYGLVPVKDCETKKWGLLGKSGEYTVEPIYDKISSSHNGIVKAELKDKTISIDIRDKVKNLRTYSYKDSEDVFDTSIPILFDWDKADKIKESPDETISDYLSEVLAVRQDNKCYFTDNSGKIISSEHSCTNILFKAGNLMVVQYWKKIKVIGLKKGEIFIKDKGTDLFATDNKSKLYYVYSIVPQKKFTFDCIKEKVLDYKTNDEGKIKYMVPEYDYNFMKLFTGTPDAQCEFNDGDNYYLKGNREMIVNSNGFIKFEQKVDEKRLKGFKEFKGKTMNLLPFSFQNLKYDNDPCNYAIRMGISASHEDWQPALSILSKNQSYDPTFAIEKELEEKRANIALNEKAIKWMESNDNNAQYADQIKELKEENKKLEKEELEK